MALQTRLEEVVNDILGFDWRTDGGEITANALIKALIHEGAAKAPRCLYEGGKADRKTESIYDVCFSVSGLCIVGVWMCNVRDISCNVKLHFAKRQQAGSVFSVMVNAFPFML